MKKKKALIFSFCRSRKIPKLFRNQPSIATVGMFTQPFGFKYIFIARDSIKSLK